MVSVRQIFTDSPLRNFTYLIGGGTGAFCLDPWDADQVIQALGGRKLLGIINTHEHGDHTRGNEGLADRYRCPVFAHPNARGKVPRAERFPSEGERISIEGDHFLQVMDTPGHTFAHLCLLWCAKNRPKAIFTGDTLFNAGVGNCHNGGDARVLFRTVSERFGELPGEVLLYPGHEYMGNNLGFTLDREPGNRAARELRERWGRVDFSGKGMVNTMDTEREVNTFLRLNSPEIIANLPDKPSAPENVFLRLRELRDKW